jgi:hypothetical protein
MIWVAAAFGIALVCMVLSSAHERESVYSALGSPRGPDIPLAHSKPDLACGGGLLGLVITLLL